MKKTQFIDSIRNIKKRIVSYLSICLVIVLGLGGFLITRYIGAGIEAKAQEYYSDRSFKNMEMISSMGVAKDDLVKISQVPGVQAVEGVIQADGTLSLGDEKLNVTIISLTDKISIPEILEGSLPTGTDQCIIGEDFSANSGIKVGDKVSLSIKGLSMGNPLRSKEFTVTGLMRHPDYVRRGTVNTVTIPLEAFDEEVTEGLFTRAYIATDVSKDIDIFNDKYFDAEKGTKDKLESLAAELSEDSEKRIRTEAETLIDEEWQKALREFKKAEDEINDGEKKLQEELGNAREQLESAEEELASRVAEGEAQLGNAEATLNTEVANARAQIADAEAQLETAKGYLTAYRAVIDYDTEEEIKASLSQYGSLDPNDEMYKRDLALFVVNNAGTIRSVQALTRSPQADVMVDAIKEINGTDISEAVTQVANMDVEHIILTCSSYLTSPDTTDMDSVIKDMDYFVNLVAFVISAVDDAEAKVADMEKQLAAAKTELERNETEGRNRIAEGWATLNSEKENAEAQIAAGWDEYNANKEKYENEIAEARKTLAEEQAKAEKAVEDARGSLNLPESNWVVLDRRGNAGYVDIRASAMAIRNASWAFGLLFLLISAMVCFSTLAIIIEEQKQMVGTVKAFGFFKKEVLGKYLVFGVSAAVLGCVLGILIAVGLADFIQVLFAKSGMYSFDQARSVITPVHTILACISMIAICAIATVIACSEILKSPASVLMNGGNTKKKKDKKTVSGRGGSLYSRLIFRNMMNDKARVLISIVIIALSTLMIGVGVSLRLAYTKMIDAELTEIYRYDVRMDMGSEVTEEQADQIKNVLDEKGAKYLMAVYEPHLFRWDGILEGAYVLAANPDNLNDFYGISHVGTQNPIAIPTEGLLAQNKMKESFGIGSGTTISILDSSLHSYDAQVVDNFQNYVGSLLVTSPEGYRKIFGDQYNENCFFIKYGGADEADIKEAIIKVTDDISFESGADFTTRFAGNAGLFDIVIYVTTGIAVIMSFMILTNLANIFVTRKKNELIVMRVNGFSIGKTIGYLVRETVMTTLLGIVLGVGIGALVTPGLVKLLENPDVQFIRHFHPLAWIIAIACQIVFAVSINSMVFSRIKKFNLKDIA